jgi:hypothetical protein
MDERKKFSWGRHSEVNPTHFGEFWSELHRNAQNVAGEW